MSWSGIRILSLKPYLLPRFPYCPSVNSILKRISLRVGLHSNLWGWEEQLTVRESSDRVNNVNSSR